MKTAAEIQRALLEVYSFRVDEDEEHRNAVWSFVLATGARLLDDEAERNRLEAAGCALFRAAHRREPVAEYTAALEAIAPKLAELKPCDECGYWRGHWLSCGSMTAQKPAAE
jgi:hypothetical protein